MARTRHKQGGKARPVPRAARSWPLAAFLSAVFLIKLVVMAQLQHHPLLQPDAGLDTETYIKLAHRVLGGDLTLGPGLYYVSPLYVYFLAAAFALDDSLRLVRLAQIVLGTAAVGCVFLTARAWFGERAAWAAGVIAAFTGVFTFYEIVIMQSALDPFLTAAALLCLARALLGGSTRMSVLAGIFFGLQVLNRPNVVVAIAGVVLCVLLVRRARVAALVTAGVVVALVPVVARNALVSHQFALVSSQGGLNFYIGNNPGATGQYQAVPGVRANIEGQSEDTRAVAEKAVGRPLTDAQVSSYFTRLATDWVRANPAAALTLFTRKLALTFNARHQWLDFSYPYYAHDVPSILGGLFVGPWLLVPLGLAGLAFARPIPAGVRPHPTATARDYFAWGSFVPFYAIGVALFFVGERYRLPLFVPLCVTSAGALDQMLEAFRKPASSPQPPTSARRLTLAACLASIVAFWPFQLDSGRFAERLRLSKVLMNRGDYGQAAMELEKAYRLEPGDTTVEFNLGMAQVAQGRAQEGLAHLRHAVDAGVPIKGARYALAGALQATGDSAGAASLLRTFSPQPDEDAESCYQVALVAIDARAPDVAERYLKRAIALRPDWTEAKQELARLQNAR